MIKSNQVIALIVTFFIGVSAIADTPKLNLDAKTLLRITGAKSVDELNNPNEEVHGIRIYYKHYKRCLIEQAKANYVYNKRKEFNANRKLTKTEWNGFIKEQLVEKLDTLTKDNLLERHRDCKLEVEKIIAQLYEFDKDWENWISWLSKKPTQEITPAQKVTPTQLAKPKPIREIKLKPVKKPEYKIDERCLKPSSQRPAGLACSSD